MRRIFRLCALVLIGGAGSAFPAWTAAYDDTLEGSWTAEQTGGQSGSPKEGALRFMRAGNGTLTGTMRLGNDETVLFDVLEMGTNVSFTIIIPGTPYVAVHYTGTRAGDAIRLAGAGDNQTAYTLTGRRVASSMPAATAAAIAPAPPPPVVAAAPPPAAAPVSQLDGNWAAEQTGPNSATSVTGSLAFTGNRGTLKTGGEEWPLFDVQITGADVGFTMVIPGTPYLTVHYSGTAMGDALQLSGLDADQRMFHLTARRGGKTPVARAAPMPEPRVALLNPPPPARANPPTPPPPAPATRSAGPPPKPVLPALRDVPPNNLAKTPPMGWASREKLVSNIEDDDIRQAAESLEETHLREAGFAYVEIDDGWQGERDANGVLHASAKFPDMKGLADYVHAKNLKLGLLLSAAPKSCGGFEGSYGHEAEDAKLLASWGIDYVVYDWCGAESLYATQAEQQAAYQKMGEALRSSGRDIVFAISQNGAFDVARWGAKTGANVWRIGADIEDNWQSMTNAGLAVNGKEGFATPGHWNDPGLLQTGNGGMTPDEYRMQLNLWAVVAAPMMLGNDVRIMTRETLAMLSNREVIAIDQDPLGRQGKRIAQAGQSEAWARPLADGSTALCFINRGNDSAPIGVSWEQLGIEGPRRVRDLWRHEDTGTFNGRYVVFLSPHTSLLLRLAR